MARLKTHVTHNGDSYKKNSVCPKDLEETFRKKGFLVAEDGEDESPKQVEAKSAEDKLSEGKKEKK